MLPKQQKRLRRHKRIRSKVKGTHNVPRLCVFRSNKHIYAQLIDDLKGNVLVAASDLELNQKKISQSGEKGKKNLKGKVALSYEVGKLIAQKALKKKIKRIVFDRAGYKYHGRVKALAEGAREGGLIF